MSPSAVLSSRAGEFTTKVTIMNTILFVYWLSLFFFYTILANDLNGSSEGLNATSTAALGGGIAAGGVLLLSLLGLCYYWGRKNTRQKHPQIFFDDVTTAPGEIECHVDLIPMGMKDTL